MQSEVIKYQPPVEGVVVTQEEEQQILKLGRIMREQLDQSHKDVRLTNQQQGSEISVKF